MAPKKRSARTPSLTVVEGGFVDRNTKAWKDATRDLSTALHDKPDAEIMCRGMRHAWVIRNEPLVYRAQGVGEVPIMRIDWECERDPENHPWRRDVFIVRRSRRKGPRGQEQYDIIERLRPEYHYPRGYQIPGVPRGVKPQIIIFQELVNRRHANVVHSDPREAQG